MCWTKEEANGAVSAVSMVMAEVTNAVVCSHFNASSRIHNVTDNPEHTYYVLCSCVFICLLLLFAVCPLLGTPLLRQKCVYIGFGYELSMLDS